MATTEATDSILGTRVRRGKGYESLRREMLRVHSGETRRP